MGLGSLGLTDSEEGKDKGLGLAHGSGLDGVGFGLGRVRIWSGPGRVKS